VFTTALVSFAFTASPANPAGLILFFGTLRSPVPNYTTIYIYIYINGFSKLFCVGVKHNPLRYIESVNYKSLKIKAIIKLIGLKKEEES
jgi:hypothetical protein